MYRGLPVQIGKRALHLGPILRVPNPNVVALDRVASAVLDEVAVLARRKLVVMAPVHAGANVLADLSVEEVLARALQVARSEEIRRQVGGAVPLVIVKERRKDSTLHELEGHSFVEAGVMCQQRPVLQVLPTREPFGPPDEELAPVR